MRQWRCWAAHNDVYAKIHKYLRKHFSHAWETWTRLYIIVNSMAADEQATLGAMASATMILSPEIFQSQHQNGYVLKCLTVNMKTIVFFAYKWLRSCLWRSFIPGTPFKNYTKSLSLWSLQSRSFTGIMAAVGRTQQWPYNLSGSWPSSPNG